MPEFPFDQYFDQIDLITSTHTPDWACPIVWKAALSSVNPLSTLLQDGTWPQWPSTSAALANQAPRASKASSTPPQIILHVTRVPPVILPTTPGNTIIR
jgi:hypothetical protein